MSCLTPIVKPYEINFSALIKVGSALLVSAALAACSPNEPSSQHSAGTTDNGTATSVMTINLSSANSAGGGISEKNTGENLLDLNGSWSNWGAGTTTVTYDASTNRLLIPASSPAQPNIVTGVKRFDQPLTEGVQYTLSVDSGNASAAAILFLFDQHGQIMPALLNQNGGLALAVSGSPLVFFAPANTAGFYLQVQNQYQATAEASLTAELRPAEQEPVTGGSELLTLTGDWPNWEGVPAGVSYDTADRRLNIAAPTGERGNTIGARRFDTSLTGMQTYQFRLTQSSDPNASALLYLFNASDELIPFSFGGVSFQWLTVTGDESVSFVAPAGVVAFAVQVQSGYQSASATQLVPSLTGVGASNMPGDDQDDINSAREAFHQALIGRRAYDCIEVDLEPFFSARFTEFYSAEYNQDNLYFYTSGNCSGLPFSDYYPPPVYRYTLGNPVPQDDGVVAWEIDAEVVVQGVQGTDTVSDPDGTKSYSIIGLRGDEIFYGEGGVNYDPATRATVLGNGEPVTVVRIAPYGDPNATVENVVGTWTSNCADETNAFLSQLDLTWVITEDTAIERYTVYEDLSCTTPLWAVENVYSTTYLPTAQGPNGDYLLRYDSVVISSSFTLEPAAGTGPTLLPVGQEKPRALVIQDNDTLIRGECFFWSPCARDADSRADMADLYNVTRARRVQQLAVGSN